MDANERQRAIEQGLQDLGASAFPDDMDLRPNIHRMLKERHGRRQVLPRARSRFAGGLALAAALAVAGLVFVLQPWAPPPDTTQRSWAVVSQESLLAMQYLDAIEEHALGAGSEVEGEEETTSQG